MSTETITPALQAYRDLLERWAVKLCREMREATQERTGTYYVAVRILRDFAYHAREQLKNRFTQERVPDEDDRTMIRVTDHFQGVSYECYKDYEAMQWIDKQQEVFPV